MPSRTAIAAGATLAAAATAAASTTTPLLGVAFRDPGFAGNTTLYDIDASTGLASNPRTTGADVITGITRDTAGNILGLTDAFGIINGQPAPSALFTINPANGATTVIGEVGTLPATGLGLSEGDLDFNPASGQLFSVTSQNGTSALFTIDPNTAAPTEIGTIPVINSDISAMAFDPSGNLWVLNTDFNFDPATRASTLLRINPVEATVAEEIPLDIALGSTAGMDFDPATGDLYIADGDLSATNNLYTVDFINGQLNLVGDTGLDGAPTGFGGIAGLEFIPAPGTAATLAAFGIAATRRRR